MTFETDIIEQERNFWMASTDFYERQLAQNVVMIFPAIGILNREQVLEGIRAGNRWSSVEMTDVSLRRSNDSTIALAYHVRARKAGSAPDYSAFAGSVYVKEGAEWKLAFHQQTPL